MTGRSIHLLAAAAVAAATSLVSASSASACYSGCGVTYAQPVVYAVPAPVVYAVTPIAPVYATTCGNPCGYGGFGDNGYGLAGAVSGYGYGAGYPYAGAGYGYGGYGYGGYGGLGLRGGLVYGGGYG